MPVIKVVCSIDLLWHSNLETWTSELKSSMEQLEYIYLYFFLHEYKNTCIVRSLRGERAGVATLLRMNKVLLLFVWCHLPVHKYCITG